MIKKYVWELMKWTTKHGEYTIKSDSRTRQYGRSHQPCATYARSAVDAHSITIA